MRGVKGTGSGCGNRILPTWGECVLREQFLSPCWSLQRPSTLPAPVASSPSFKSPRTCLPSLSGCPSSDPPGWTVPPEGLQQRPCPALPAGPSVWHSAGTAALSAHVWPPGLNPTAQLQRKMEERRLRLQEAANRCGPSHRPRPRGSWEHWRGPPPPQPEAPSRCFLPGGSAVRSP